MRTGDRSLVLQWFVIQTKPFQETRVEKNLLHQEIETFLPLYRTIHRKGSRVVPKNLPLFPHYLFARMDLKCHYHRVRWTRGVNRILGNGDEPLPVSPEVVETIKGRADRENVVRLEDPQEGDPVRIISGPFKDLIGIFDRKMSDQDRVRILLSLMGIEVPVQISSWQLQKIA